MEVDVKTTKVQRELCPGFKLHYNNKTREIIVNAVSSSYRNKEQDQLYNTVKS